MAYCARWLQLDERGLHTGTPECPDEFFSLHASKEDRDCYTAKVSAIHEPSYAFECDLSPALIAETAAALARGELGLAVEHDPRRSAPQPAAA